MAQTSLACDPRLSSRGVSAERDQAPCRSVTLPFYAPSLRRSNVVLAVPQPLELFLQRAQLPDDRSEFVVHDLSIPLGLNVKPGRSCLPLPTAGAVSADGWDASR
jgi:hypothetical protein